MTLQNNRQPIPLSNDKPEEADKFRVIELSGGTMKQISNKEYEAYQQYQTDKLHGRILTPDGLRLICASFDNDPEQIGKHMLEMLAKFKAEGIVG